MICDLSGCLALSMKSIASDHLAGQVARQIVARQPGTYFAYRERLLQACAHKLGFGEAAEAPIGPSSVSIAMCSAGAPDGSPS